jgi:hypothetical protein
MVPFRSTYQCVGKADGAEYACKSIPKRKLLCREDYYQELDDRNPPFLIQPCSDARRDEAREIAQERAGGHGGDVVDERADAHLALHLRCHRHRRLYRRLRPRRGMVSPPLARSAPGARVRSRLTGPCGSASAGGSSSRGAVSSERPSRRPGSRRRTSSGAES